MVGGSGEILGSERKREAKIFLLLLSALDYVSGKDCISSLAPTPVSKPTVSQFPNVDYLSLI